MRKLVTWLVVTLGIAALVRKLRKRNEPEWVSEPATEPAPAAEPPAAAEPATEPTAASSEAEGDPAAELREKLARSRADMPSSEGSPEERRAAVHEQGRAAVDEMQPGGAPPDAPADGPASGTE